MAAVAAQPHQAELRRSYDPRGASALDSFAQPLKPRIDIESYSLGQAHLNSRSARQSGEGGQHRKLVMRK